MNKYTAYICDDSEKDRIYVRELLKKYGVRRDCVFEIVEFDSGEGLLQEISGGRNSVKNPDMIFLDISMEQLDGMETARRIRELWPKVPIVLVTAYIHYALEGYKVRASRFLLKDELEDTISECVDSIRTELGRRSREMDFLFVEGKVRLKLCDIVYIETNAHVQIFHVAGRIYRIYKKLDAVEKELAPYGFVRVHKSYVVNLMYVIKISSYRLYLSTGEEISVPKGRYQEVKSRYAAFRGGSL